MTKQYVIVCKHPVDAQIKGWLKACGKEFKTRKEFTAHSLSEHNVVRATHETKRVST